VKCPKCDYLGFETGDRCKNCGYDFSLLTPVEAEPSDYEIHPAAMDDVPVHIIDEIDRHRPWIDTRDDPDIDAMLTPLTPLTPFASDTGPTQVTLAASIRSELPLFMTSDDKDDEPLVKLPLAPRPPLAVRRTADTPRLRAVPRPVVRPVSAPVLQFSDEGPERSSTRAERVEKIEPVASHAASAVATESPSRPAARAVAVLIDHLILLGIDIGVIYFTLRLAGLSMAEWSLLPVVPMLTFLGLLKVAYFYAFTAVGGQTIGKMAVGTCVVGENGLPVDAGCAMRRTTAGIASFLLLGLGFVPALFGDHRALHDRLAHTRVVRLRSV